MSISKTANLMYGCPPFEQKVLTSIVFLVFKSCRSSCDEISSLIACRCCSIALVRASLMACAQSSSFSPILPSRKAHTTCVLSAFEAIMPIPSALFAFQLLISMLMDMQLSSSLFICASYSLLLFSGCSLIYPFPELLQTPSILIARSVQFQKDVDVYH